MAAVYRAWDHRLRRWRAIKVLLPEYAQKPRLRARFENEAALMAQIDHPHVVAVDDVITDEPLPYIVMELADGGSLTDWLELYGPMPPRLAVTAALQICAGVGAAHALGVIHRDLKPHNVILTSSGVCRVTDFGIAQVAGVDLTGTGTALGTLGYMAPEQRADARSVDVRADVYSIGATLYALLKHAIVPDLFVCEQEPSLLDGIPGPLRAVIRRCVAYAPDARWPDVHYLAAALGETLSRLPPDPVDTPALAVPPEGRLSFPVDDPAPGPGDGTPGFPEIAPLLTGTPIPPPRVLPYIMPERDTAPADETPSWLVTDDAPSSAPADRSEAAVSRRSVTPSPARRGRGSHVPASERPTAPGPVPRSVTPDPARRATPSHPRASTPPQVGRTVTPRPAESRRTPHHASRTATPSPTARTATPGPTARTATPSPARRTATPAPAHRTATPGPTRRTATPGPERRTATPGAPQREEEPTLEAARTVGEFVAQILLSSLKVLARPLAAFSIPILGMTLIFGLAFGGAALSVRSAEAEAHARRTAFYEALEHERRLVDDLVALGASRHTLETLLSGFSQQRQEPQRYDSALRLLNQLDQETRRWAPRTVNDPAGRAASARERIERLRGAVTAYEQALQSWEEASRESRARAAIRFGCARAP